MNEIIKTHIRPGENVEFPEILIITLFSESDPKLGEILNMIRGYIIHMTESKKPINILFNICFETNIEFPEILKFIELIDYIEKISKIYELDISFIVKGYITISLLPILFSEYEVIISKFSTFFNLFDVEDIAKYNNGYYKIMNEYFDHLYKNENFNINDDFTKEYFLEKKLIIQL